MIAMKAEVPNAFLSTNREKLRNGIGTKASFMTDRLLFKVGTHSSLNLSSNGLLINGQSNVSLFNHLGTSRMGLMSVTIVDGFENPVGSKLCAFWTSSMTQFMNFLRDY